MDSLTGGRLPPRRVGKPHYVANRYDRFVFGRLVRMDLDNGSGQSNGRSSIFPLFAATPNPTQPIAKGVAGANLPARVAVPEFWEAICCRRRWMAGIPIG